MGKRRTSSELRKALPPFWEGQARSGSRIPKELLYEKVRQDIHVYEKEKKVTSSFQAGRDPLEAGRDP